MMFDDGFVAYLNGVRVADANAPVNIAWNSTATEGHSDSDAKKFKAFSISRHIKHLKKGKNVLAIHGLNVSKTSSDFLIQPQLRGGLGSGESIVNYFDNGFKYKESNRNHHWLKHNNGFHERHKIDATVWFL